MFTSQAIKPYKIVSLVPIQNYQMIHTTKQNTENLVQQFLPLPSSRTHNTCENKDATTKMEGSAIRSILSTRETRTVKILTARIFFILP